MEKLNLAIIGLGQRGSGLLSTILKTIPEIEIVALSDNYQDRVDNAVKSVVEARGNTPFGTTDYTELLKRDD
ncbi:MAG: gfo/Idh/MocA family oxidoreductase, partial [Clostridia bacterium]|nr:gfo/Idh/MocA family oxidoreductase [Clostridia bacterium]